jgi:hypothetical protein
MLRIAGINWRFSQLVYPLSWLTLAFVSVRLTNLKVLVSNPTSKVSFCLILLLSLSASILLSLERSKRQRFITRESSLPAKVPSFIKATFPVFLLTIVLILKYVVYPFLEIFYITVLLLGIFIFIGTIIFLIKPLFLIRKGVPHHIWITNILANIIVVIVLFNLSGSDSPSACGVHNKRKCVPKGKFRNAPSACGGDRNFSAPQLLLLCYS